MQKKQENADLLLEIGCEELPAAEQDELLEGLRARVLAGLDNANLAYGEARAYATPRRLALLINALQTKQADQKIRRRGPALKIAYDKAGKPSPACLGFARSCGVSASALEQDENYVYYEGLERGQKTEDILAALLKDVLPQLPRRKTMRWDGGTHSPAFTRAVRWLVLIVGEKSIDWQSFGLSSSNLTHGHRAYCDQPLRIQAASDYVETLATKGYVIVDKQKRKERILKSARKLAAKQAGRLYESDSLVEEIANITELPVAYVGKFEKEFLQLPQEVINSVLIDKQRCFPILDKAGKHLPHFVFVANIRSDRPARLISGNEAVVRPRLRDAAFFYEKDLEQGMDNMEEKLKDVAFFGELGNMQQKSWRCAELAKEIATLLNAAPDLTMTAGLYCKCDLISLMVQEFPELQGIMGGYYLSQEEQPPKSPQEIQACATAIAEHYLPDHSGAPIPATPMGRSLALADKLDSLVGLFAKGYQPAGDSDPYGLRRLALGVLRIIVESRLHIDLRQLLLSAATGYSRIQLQIPNDICENVLGFINERIHSYASQAERAVIAAVFNPPQADLYDGWLRVAALTKIPMAQLETLIALDKRLKNILNDSQYTAGQVDKKLLGEAAEQELHRVYLELYESYSIAAKTRDYEECCRVLTGLSYALERFFEEVLVMTKDESLRENRLRLLHLIRQPFIRMGDLSRLQAATKTPRNERQQKKD